MECKGPYPSAGVHHRAVPVVCTVHVRAVCFPGHLAVAPTAAGLRRHGRRRQQQGKLEAGAGRAVLVGSAPGRALLLQGHIFSRGTTAAEASGPSIRAGRGRQGTWLHF